MANFSQHSNTEIAHRQSNVLDSNWSDLVLNTYVEIRDKFIDKIFGWLAWAQHSVSFRLCVKNDRWKMQSSIDSIDCFDFTPNHNLTLNSRNTQKTSVTVKVSWTIILNALNNFLWFIYYVLTDLEISLTWPQMFNIFCWHAAITHNYLLNFWNVHHFYSIITQIFWIFWFQMFRNLHDIPETFETS